MPAAKKPTKAKTRKPATKTRSKATKAKKGR